MDRLAASLQRSADGLRQASTNRVDNAVNVNDELRGSLLGLEKTVKRMQQLPQNNAVSNGVHNLMGSELTQNRLTEVTEKVQLLSTR